MPLLKGKMRCFKLLLMFSIVAVLASACSLGGQKAQTIGETHQGTQGIVFNFLSNYPPPIIYTSGGDTGNNIVLEVKNLGSTKTGAYFYLSGFDKNIIQTGTDQYVLGALDAKTTTNPDGGYTQIQFPSYGTLSINMPKDIDVYPVTIQATACYDYQTLASIPVCVDPDPYSPVATKACVPHGAAVGAGQGAPVSVTSVEQESLRGQVIFKIRVGNVGDGQVIERGNTPICTQLKYDKFDRIYYAPFKLGGAAGQCLPNAPIRLVNKQALITCVFNVPPGNLAYTTTLDVNMDYGYMASKQQSLQIRKIS